MTLENVRKMPWKPVKDWSELVVSGCKRRKLNYVSEKDIEAFITNICQDIARRLDLPSKSLFQIIKSENKAFFGTKRRLFFWREYLEMDSELLKELQKLLRVPDVEAFFEGLSVQTKLKLLQRDLEMLKDSIEGVGREGISECYSKDEIPVASLEWEDEKEI